MDAKRYDKSNFYKHTFCVFREVEASEIANRKTDYKSKSGSTYFFTETGVYRLSNHWGRAANCKWRLESLSPNPSRTKVGFALWSAFHRDNDSEKLYFIETDFSNQTVSYQHKDNGSYNGEILRTASETAKIIRQIRNLFASDSWANYFDTQDVDGLRRKIIKRLMATNRPLSEIKSAFRNSG